VKEIGVDWLESVTEIWDLLLS